LTSYQKDRTPAKDEVQQLLLKDAFLDPRQEALVVFDEFKNSFSTYQTFKN